MKKILTGISALYMHNIISYSPNKKHVEMLYGTNSSKYAKEYKVSFQKESTFKIGMMQIGKTYLYKPERLFIEINKFQMENTIRNEALAKLKATISPELVKKYYKQLKKHRRGLNNKVIETFLEKNLLNIKEVLNKNEDKKTIIREYLMALLGKKEIPLSIIKGGSAIELFTPIKRATLDLDVHIDSENIKSLLKYLNNKNRDIYFKLNPNDQSETKLATFFSKNKKSSILKISFLPISKGGTHKKDLENIVLPVSLNTTYNQKELKDIICFYQITKRKLKYLPNALAIIFTKEMLLAEKFQSLIVKPTISSRTKDLIDLKLLWDSKINANHFCKWVFRKWKNVRNPLEKKEAKEIIQKNSKKELTKIKDNFNEAISMYEINYQYQDCLKIYKKLVEIALN